MLSPVIIGITGAVAGEVDKVRSHPRGNFIWLADVDLGDGDGLVQIVFGGAHKLTGGELVPVAPPGSRVAFQYPDASRRTKKMRARRYRGERSHGMLCSLDELGWLQGGPDEVAVLRDLKPGQSLDDLHPDSRPAFVMKWERAKQMEKVKKWAATERASLAAAFSDLVVEYC